MVLSGPRAGRVVFNIQDGFRICEFRGVLCTKRCRSFSLFFYFVVDSVGVISVDIYSNSVSDNLLQYLQSWAIQYGSLDSSWILVCCTFTNLSLYVCFRKIYLHKSTPAVNNKEVPGVSILKVRYLKIKSFILFDATDPPKFMLSVNLPRWLPWSNSLMLLLCSLWSEKSLIL